MLPGPGLIAGPGVVTSRARRAPAATAAFRQATFLRPSATMSTARVTAWSICALVRPRQAAGTLVTVTCRSIARTP